MFLKPKYAENIIVGIVLKDKLAWYCTEQDVWILDLYKYAEGFIKNGYRFDMDFQLSCRNNIAIINEDSAEEFLQSYHENIVESKYLGDLLREKNYEGTVLAMRPSLYINFDKKQLYSIYPEYTAFEKYVPDGWKGEFCDFNYLIPKEERYWIENEVNIIQEEFRKEEMELKEREKYE